MSQEPDIRSLLESKTRAKVSPRNSSLLPEESMPQTLASESDEPPEAVVSQDTNSSDRQLKLEAELKNLPQIGKRLAVHLENSVRNDLLKL